MRIAVDFDGTIVKHRYPEIGEPIPFALETLLQIQQLGHQLILWTVREGRLLDEAVLYCKERGLEFYAINKDHPETGSERISRKLSVDLFIDDRNFGGLPDWGLILHTLKAGEKRCFASDCFFSHGYIPVQSPKKKWWQREK